MAQSEIHHLRRLYHAGALERNAEITFEGNAHHYIRNVMRMQPGDKLRVFNEKQGEFLAGLAAVEKKTATAMIGENLRVPTPAPKLHLFCPMLPKDRFDWVVEKGTELGMSDLHVISTERSQDKPLKAERIHAQMVEAAEQSERLSVPQLHETISIEQALNTLNLPVYVALERAGVSSSIFEAVQKTDLSEALACMIGPPGGWSDAEKEMLSSHKRVVPVSLGATILRSETAAIYMLTACRAALEENR